MDKRGDFYIREIDPERDFTLMERIVEHEDKVFREGSVGKWNIRPFARYGKVFVVLREKGLNGKIDQRHEEAPQRQELVSVIEVLPSFERDTAYIYGVSTVTEHERQGHVKRLLNYVIKYLMEKEIKKIELTVGTGNERAIKIYKNAGFRIVKTIQGEYGPGIDRYLMRLDS